MARCFSADEGNGSSQRDVGNKCKRNEHERHFRFSFYDASRISYPISRAVAAGAASHFNCSTYRLFSVLALDCSKTLFL
ncbi:hypothetical protein ALC57_11342 [Trachymyrmex cornetzi]|uniref:Uncharacterized protein n=1 Tax=Trachymyrmex cornetzi TaxID=471704 RepID=A0A195DUP3_9HYME|nr:hypothetical protein ALC57_11342 [Trachymyrmex cornetzi]